MDIRTLTWPVSRLGDAIAELSRQAGLGPEVGDMTAPPLDIVDPDGVNLGTWISWASNRIGVEACAIDTAMSGFGKLIGSAAPALLYCDDGQHSGFLLLLSNRKSRVRLVGPDLTIQSVDRDRFIKALTTPYEAHLAPETDRLLDHCKLPAKTRAKVRNHLMDARIGQLRIGRCWMLRSRATGRLESQVRGSRWAGQLAAMLGVLLLVYGLDVAGWGLIGNVTLNGRLDLGWLTGWCLMLASLIPLRALSGWMEQSFILQTSQMMKQRAFCGALRLDIDQFKGQGVGQLLGRVIESQALESLAFNGGLGVLVGAVELLFAIWVLALGAGGLLHVVLLLAWLGFNLTISAKYIERLKQWTTWRLKITQTLVENMLGHRTRLVQESVDRRDRQQDRDMAGYHEASQAMDEAVSPLLSIAPAGWLIIALVGLVPALLQGSATTPALAVSLGGILLASRALGSVGGGVTAVARAGIAWKQVGELFAAAARPHEPTPYYTAKAFDDPATGIPLGNLIDASRLTFRHAPNMPPVLNNIDLTIRHGEHILLCGDSGGGKSTLASLLAGLRQPDSGLLLLGGLDRHTLAEGWHKLVCSAPQFHENHILSGPLGMNLLMGRAWPASARDLKEAQEICEDLGLGDLLDRMPGGLMQMVGETGWQLSHGEQSRVFLARALLQKAPLTLLDESFAALDPENLRICVAAAFKHAKTLLVIAHP